MRSSRRKPKKERPRPITSPKTRLFSSPRPYGLMTILEDLTALSGHVRSRPCPIGPILGGCGSLVEPANGTIPQAV